MSRTLLETHQHPKYPRLRLDLRDDSTFYQARTFLDGKQRQKSTGTGQLPAALKIAEDWYKRELRASVQFGRQHPIERLTADPVMGEAFRSYAADLDKRKQKEAENRWNPIQEFWRGLRLEEINAQTFRQFFKWRRSRNNTIKAHTLHKDAILIRQILKRAVEDEMLDALPAIPKPGKIEANPRPWLTPQEWEHLVTVSEQRIEASSNVRVLQQRTDLHDQMLFMVHTMVRVGEMLNLKFSDCRFERGVDRSEILIADIRGKRNHRAIVAPAEAASIVKRRMQDHKDDDLVFPVHHREAFKELLHAAKLYRDRDGFSRNMKSLRATAISFRVMQSSPNLLLIARNAGTSVAMIDQFYAKRLTAESHKTELGRSVVPTVKKASIDAAEWQELVESLARGEF